MILHPLPDGFIAVRQSAHALLAFQLADHWGNRTTPRPSPRADVLAAVLLHDAGWDDHEVPPRLGPEGKPLAYDTIGSDERQAIWTASVERAGVRGRYAAYLVSHHFSSLAERDPARPLAPFIANEKTRQEQLRAALALDSRYRQLLSAPADGVNRAIVRLCDALAVLLSRNGGDAGLRDLPQREGFTSLEVVRSAERVYRLHPWPFTGGRLHVATEGKRLARSGFASEAELREAWQVAPIVPLDWTLLARGFDAT